MHYVCEIIMPPTDNVEEAVTKAMKEFDENEGDTSKYAFWDFWVIGGRYSGHKLSFKYPKDQLEAFYAELQKREVKVSSVVCGKQSLLPEFIPAVDKLWSEMVPGFGNVCPLFDHFNDQYVNSDRYPDIALLEETPLNTTCCRVMILGEDFKPVFMLCEDYYNGVNFQDTKWDRTLGHAIELWNNHYSFKDGLVSDDSLVVTVDYHS